MWEILETARSKKFKKTIDKYPYLCYNNYSKGEIAMKHWVKVLLMMLITSIPILIFAFCFLIIILIEMGKVI